MERRRENPAPADQERIRTLVIQLGDEDYTIREQASRALLAIGRPAVKILQDAIKNPDTDVEVLFRAKELLEQISQKERFGG